MRSLALKLTLAFLSVGMLGVILFALLVGQRAQADLRTFVSERDRDALMSAIEQHYAARGNWDHVEETLRSRPLNYVSRGMALSDGNYKVVVPNQWYKPGSTIADSYKPRLIPVRVRGDVVGYALFPYTQEVISDEEGQLPQIPRPEREFWQRTVSSAAISAVVTLALSLGVGWFLARSLTRPVSELTIATQAMASGQLGQTVSVRSRDELGELASAFNKMSGDLQQSSQARKQMTADLAHDLRTPLSVLRGYTEGLKEQRIEPNPAIFAVMHEEVEHLQRMVEDLRTLSLADAGELTLNMRTIDPRALIERAVLAHFVRAEAQGITLRIDAEANLPSLHVDTDRLAQVLDNLVSNALAHTHRGEIVLRARHVDGTILLSVSDTGSGIMAADLPHVFDRFYRGDAARQRTDQASSGLGLAIARAIVEAHRGNISVSSTPGTGTTFAVALPVSA